jgi:alginate O-acetyltransferase complex protein AlgI
MPSIDLSYLVRELAYDPANPLLFNNGFFVYFFTAFITLYYLFRNHYNVRRYIFCFFSLYFFYKASGYFVGLVIISAVVDYFLSNAIFRQRHAGKKKFLLLVSIVFNLGMLVYFKYTNFFISLSNDLFQSGFNPLNILLPVGISFYTFENLSYTIDVYRGQFEPARKFTDYLLFLSFFPKLVMGPIVRAHDFVPQINKPYRISDRYFSEGFFLILTGLFKKLIISDYLTLNYVNYIFDDPGRYTGIENLTAVYAYAAVIYCDFSGYSDVAIGIARWLGFHIPTNFLSPYQSASITEFWRRWHMSLSSWLKDYLYIPLGGNRKSSVGTIVISTLFFGAVFYLFIAYFEWSIYLSIILVAVLALLFLLPTLAGREKTSPATNFNLLSTMLIGGLWHGASLNFLLWGALHGIGLAFHKCWLLIAPSSFTAKRPLRIYQIFGALITFHFVCFCWIFFKSSDFNHAAIMIRQITGNLDFSVAVEFFMNYHKVLYMLILAIILHLLPDSLQLRLTEKSGRIPFIAYFMLFMAFLLLYGYFKSAEPVLPIYLQF